MRIFSYHIREGHCRADTDAVLLRCAENFAQAAEKPVPKRIFHTESGKPYVKESGIFIGAAHTEKILFAAACDVPFGIDAESIKRDVRGASKIAEKYFFDEERALLKNGKRTFAELWTAKEAFLKLTGEGLAGLRRANTASLPYAFEYIGFSDVLICVCSENPVKDISVAPFELTEENPGFVKTF